VALARALAIEPRVLLLDEPFGALDAKVRKELRRWLRHLHDELKVTSVFVTHDQEEAMELADRVVILSKGRIEQLGTPEEVYEQPVSAFVHEFIGDSLTVPVSIDAGAVRYAGRAIALDARGAPNGEARLYIRPHELAITADPAGINGTVKRVQRIGPVHRVEIALSNGKGEHLIEVDAPRSQDLSVGQSVGLHPHDYRIFAVKHSIAP
jgi:sulfate transport system ATP-binding protein